MRAIADDHRFRGRGAVAMHELDRERYRERVMCEFSIYIERLLQARGVTLEVVQQSAREDWIQALVRADFGVAFMPASIAEAAYLSYVHVEDIPIVREVSVLVQAERPTSEAARATGSRRLSGFGSIAAFVDRRGSAQTPSSSPSSNTAGSSLK